ncbi:MAG: hypothetical protein IJH75_07125, partial [Mogibacterium sp.]|nr:hypothetical protein [Mogibacterium sp.]
RWWDYSAKPFNFHGYICLEFSILWGLGIVFIVREVQPFMAELTARSIPERIGWPVMAVLYLIYAVDLVVSVLIMAGLNRQMAELDEMREKMRVVSNGLSTRLGEGALDAAQHLEEARVQAALAGKELRDNAEELKEQLESEHRENEARARAYREELEKQLEQSRLEFEAKREEFLQKASSGKFFGTGRILRAFPDMEHHEHGELLEMIREHMNETRKADK